MIVVLNNVTLAHGGGGKLSKEIEGLFRRRFTNPFLEQGGDGAILPPIHESICYSTDTFVVDPLIFPGGDIGRLAVAGTVNDLLTMGARPLYLSIGVILEEGFAIATLEKIIDSIAATANEAKVQIVTGDTKVVGRNQGGGIYLNTTGIGAVAPADEACPGLIETEMSVVISGTIGEHGMAILQAREALPLTEAFISDVAPLNDLLEKVKNAGIKIKGMRDPSRGGLASTLNELALSAGLGIQLEAQHIPIRSQVRGACAILGLDPLELASEGRMLFFCAKNQAKLLVDALRSHPLGAEAAIIGHTFASGKGEVFLKDSSGSNRRVMMPVGESLPRIC